jgi:hypothetical protein
MRERAPSRADSGPTDEHDHEASPPFVLAEPYDTAAVRIGALVHDPKPAMAPVKVDGTPDVLGQ